MEHLNVIISIAFLSILHMRDVHCAVKTCGNVTLCHWMEWNPWSSCSASCGGGVRTSRRVACCRYSWYDFWDCLRDCRLDRHDAERLLTCGQNITCPPTTTTTTTTTTQATTTLQPTTHASQIDLDLTQDIDVVCGDSGWDISVLVAPLQKQYSDFKASDIYLGYEKCHGQMVGDKLVLQYGYLDCHTSEIVLSDKTVYSNTLIYAYHDPVYTFVTREYRFRIKLHCYFTNNDGSQPSSNAQGSNPLSSGGVRLSFYNDSGFGHSQELSDFQIGEDVFVKASSFSRDAQTEMMLKDCYLRPSLHADRSLTYFVVRDGCVIDANAKILSRNQQDTFLQFQAFEFANQHHSIFMTCNATFCPTNSSAPDCTASCSHPGRRGRREVHMYPVYDGKDHSVLYALLPLTVLSLYLIGVMMCMKLVKTESKDSFNQSKRKDRSLKRKE